MTMQADLDELIDGIADDYMNHLDDYAEDVINKVERIRSDVYDILDDYSRKDGRISRSRINTLIRSLDDVEQDIYLELSEELEDAITETVKKAEKQTNGALLGLLGASLLLGSDGKKLNAEETVGSVVNFVLTRKAADGLSLSDRVRSIAGLMRDEVQQAIRYGVLRGDTVGRISRRVREAFKSASWRIGRVVKTEIPLAFRKTLLYIGGKQGIIKAVKIIDLRGRHKYHERHECYRLAEQDMYGWGKGVYRPEDTFILDPHPQCTAYFRYILNDVELQGGDQ